MAESENLSIVGLASSEAGAWSNAYLVSDERHVLLFDAPMLQSDAQALADVIERTGKRLTTVFVSHAHPDHFLASDVIADRFPGARFVSVPSVAADLQADGPRILDMVRSRLGPEAPKRLVIPELLQGSNFEFAGRRLDIIEFGESEAKHMATLYDPQQRALLAADIVYNGAHLYLQERHIESWLTRLDELERYARGRVETFFPGHGAPGDMRLIAETRAYLNAFASALKEGDATALEKRMLDAFPAHRVKPFLTVFSIPAYFPAKSQAGAFSRPE